MKTLLIPTDFSPEAEKAYALAGAIARVYKADVCVLNIVRSHVDDLVGHWSGTSLLYNKVDVSKHDAQDVGAVTEKLKSLAARKEFEGVNVLTKTSTSYGGDIVNEIIEEINHKDYGLIVMGTAGDQQKGESFAELVARHSVTPVITTKSKLSDFNPKNIVLCTDFESVTMGFLQRIRSIKEHFDGKLKVLYINTPKHFKTTVQVEESAKKMARKFLLGDYELFIHNANEVKTGIQEFISREPSDMLALSTHGRTGMLHYFYGSNTEDLINECDVPVYSYNLHEYLKNASSGGTIYTRGFTG